MADDSLAPTPSVEGLTGEQIIFVQRQIIRWISLARASGYVPIAGGWANAENEVAHSALLVHLLRGKEPYPKPPPRMFAYPAFDFLERGWIDAEVSVWPQFPNQFIINQAAWERIDDNHARWGDYVVRIEENPNNRYLQHRIFLESQ